MSSEQRPFFVFDLDGTLALTEHRHHYITGQRKDWDAFFQACNGDSPNTAVIAALHAHLSALHRVEIWSARSEVVRSETEAWLDRHGIPSALLTKMRPAYNTIPDERLKLMWLQDEQPPPIAVYDDRRKVVEMWRANGVQCFQVASGDF